MRLFIHRLMTRCAATGILLLPQLALAADLPKVAVVGVHQATLEEAAQNKVAAAVAKALDEGGAVDGLSPSEVARTLAGREGIVLEQGLLAEGRELLASARTLYINAQSEEAIPLLQQAITALENGVAGANSVRDLWEAWVYLGACHRQADAGPAAEQAFRAASALAPTRLPDSAAFPPDLIEAYRGALASLQAQAVDLVIQTEPKAQVWVDGELKGVAPLVVKGALPGTHYLVVRGEQGQAYQKLTVAAGDATPVSAPLKAPSLGQPAASASGRARQAGALYKAIGRHATDVDLLLLAGTDGNNLQLQLYAPKTESFGTLLSTPVQADVGAQIEGSLPTLLEQIDDQGQLLPNARAPLAASLDLATNPLLARLLTQPAPVLAVAPVGPTEEDSGKSKKGLMWGLIGGGIGVAVLGTGGALLATGAFAGPEEPVQAGTITIGPF
jgi:hypothetical protein